LVALLLLRYALQYLEVSLRDFLSEFVSPLKILLVSIPAVLLIRIGFHRIGPGPDVLFLAAAVLLSLAVWFGGVMAFDKQAASELLSRFKRDRS